MTLALLRSRFAAFAAKIETTPGTDAIAGTPGASDWVAGTFEVQYNPQTVANPEFTGSLDSAPAIAGGLQPRVTLRVPLRGSGTAGTAPDWATLMRCCTMSQTDTAAAVGAPTAATAGTTTSATAASPFGTTAQQYRGMPMIITGTAAETTVITDYTAGRVATFGSTLSTSATTGSNLQIPVNNLFAPTSDESVSKTATIYGFIDGRRWIFTGWQGTWTLTISAGGIGQLVFEGTAQMNAAPSSVSLPSGALAAVRATPPIWVNGRCNFNRTLARVGALSLAANIGSVLPTNPEAAEGYDPAVTTSRAFGGTIDPYIDTATANALFTNFRAGTPMPLMAIIGATAGNRFAVTIPNARAESLDPSDRGGLVQHGISFQCDGADAGAFLCAF